MTEVVIAGACRTAIGAFGGALKDVAATDLGAIVIAEALARTAVEPASVSEVVLGSVLQAGAGMNVARQASLKAGVPVSVPAETINRVCGSGLQAVIHAVEAIRANHADLVVAGGAESMSNAAYVLPGARWGYRMGHKEIADTLLSDGLHCAINRTHMGITAENVAARYHVSRADQDAFASESQRRAAEAMEHGEFRSEIVAVNVAQKGLTIAFAQDEHPRPGTTPEKLATLKPAFLNDGSVTAGNSSGINDGAAAMVVCGADLARRRGIEPLARVVSCAVTGVDPALMGIGPVAAIEKALRRAGLAIADIDLFELNEAFAAQSLAVLRELAIDPAKVNVRGGAIALGHPIGASGARVLTTLLYALRDRGLRRGVASLCIGGGMGIAVVVEALAWP